MLVDSRNVSEENRKKELIGKAQSQTANILKQMVDADILITEGIGRSTKYALKK